MFAHTYIEYKYMIKKYINGKLAVHEDEYCAFVY